MSCNCIPTTSQSCCIRSGAQPTICVQELSKAQKPFLNVDVDATGFAGGTDDVLAGNLARIGVKCVNLDPCCTSTLSFATSTNLVAFLNADAVAVAALPAPAKALYDYLQGKYTCGQPCC